MGKSFLSLVKGAFVTEVTDDIKTEEVQQPIQTVAVTQPTITVQTPVVTSSLIQQSQDGQVVGQINESLLENLCVVLDEKNLPGPDYLELKSAANDVTMKNAIPDEANRFTCAYISMKVNAPQLSKTTIINSIDKYVEYLEIERQNGLSELASKWKEEVEDKEVLVEEAKKELTELQNSLNEKLKFISDTNNEITVSKNQCTVNKANFNVTVDYIINGLNVDKTKLSNILKD